VKLFFVSSLSFFQKEKGKKKENQVSSEAKLPKIEKEKNIVFFNPFGPDCHSNGKRTICQRMALKLNGKE
jgi:hypothetical protein